MGWHLSPLNYTGKGKQVDRVLFGRKNRIWTTSSMCGKSMRKEKISVCAIVVVEKLLNAKALSVSLSQTHTHIHMHIKLMHVVHI